MNTRHFYNFIKLAFPAIMLWLVTFVSIAQDDLSKEKNFHKRGKITVKGQKEIRICDITVNKDSVNYRQYSSVLNISTSIGDIEELKPQSGTCMVAGALVATALTFVLTLDPMIDDQPNAKNAGLIWVGVLAGSAVIGGLVGYTVPVYKPYKFP